MGNEVKHGNKKKIAFLVVGLLAVVLIVGSIVAFFKSDDIKSVRKVLKAKYYNIECLDSYCNGIMAEEGDKLGTSKVVLLNNEGKTVAKYKSKYDGKAKTRKSPYQVTKNYFIAKKVSVTDNKVTGYTINAKNGKELYSTEKTLNVLSDNYVLMKDKNTSTIIDKNGKEKYTNIKDSSTYANGNIIYINIEDQYILLNSKGDQILNGYRVAREVTINDEPAYLIVKDVKNDVYQYFDIKKGEVRGDVFESYTSTDVEGEFVVTKSDNGKKKKYTLNAKGKQTIIEDGFVKVDVINALQEQISTDDYYIYSPAIYKKDQNVILVDDLKNKEIGVLDVSKKKFTKIYSYKSDKSSVYSSVTKLNIDEDNAYLQISCNAYNCDKAKTVVYDMKNQKTLYTLEGSDLIAQRYIQYSDGYKVLKYSYSSTNSEYKGLFVLYNDKNKELLKSKNEIIVVDKEITFGSVYSSSIVLYSAKANKALNTENSTATAITIGTRKLYKYTDSNNNTVVLNEKGKEVIKVKSGNYLKYTNESIVYIDEKVVKIYDTNTFKTRKYKLKNNEKLNDGAGDIIPPYRGALFVNNSSDNYVKVVNSKGRVIKTIRKNQISTVHRNNKNENVFIITKTKGKTGNLYGLYLAK